MKILIGIPCVDDIPFLNVASLTNFVINTKHDVIPFFCNGSLVYDSRNCIVNQALDNNADYVMFIDDDIVFKYDDIDKLIAHSKDIVSGLYFGRREGRNEPIAYKRVYPYNIFRKRAKTDIIDDVDTFQEVQGVGMGFCLIKTDVFRKILKHYPTPFEPMKCMGEDLSFCYRARRLGYKVYVDPSILLGHCGMKVYGKDDYTRNKKVV